MVNGEWLTDAKYCTHYLVRKIENIEVTGNILDYLTQDELEKAMQKKLTDTDLIAIISKIKESEQEKGQSKVLIP